MGGAAVADDEQRPAVWDAALLAHKMREDFHSEELQQQQDIDHRDSGI
jgi:hypothetical protein